MERQLLSAVKSKDTLVGYRLLGDLYVAQELLDRMLTVAASSDDSTRMIAQSCPDVLDRAVLDRIAYFEKLPSIPFWAIPHSRSSEDATAASAPRDILLNPSACYHVYSHFANQALSEPSRSIALRTRCHRLEPKSNDPLRLCSFNMREYVCIGSPSDVRDLSQAIFSRTFECVHKLAKTAYIESATDPFYGKSATIAKKVQAAMDVKKELCIPRLSYKPIAVASWNLHRSLFTHSFAISSPENGSDLHSACVAFGLERLLFALLEHTPDHDPLVLIDNIRRVSRPAQLQTVL